MKKDCGSVPLPFVPGLENECIDNTTLYVGAHPHISSLVTPVLPTLRNPFSSDTYPLSNRDIHPLPCCSTGAQQRNMLAIPASGSNEPQGVRNVASCYPVGKLGRFGLDIEPQPAQIQQYGVCPRHRKMKCKVTEPRPKEII